MNLLRTTIAAVALTAGLVAANAASAFERWVDIVNNGTTPIRSVFITNVDDPNYGHDLLGQYLIPAGYHMRVEPQIHDGYCRFDVLITFETGPDLKLWGVNLCEATTISMDDQEWRIDYI